MQRRSFLGVSLGVIGSLALRDRAVAKLAPSGPSILQGATSETETQISILLPKYARPTFIANEVTPPGSGMSVVSSHDILPSEIHATSRSYSNWVFHTVRFEGLEPGKTYRLEVQEANDGLWDTREFQTLDRSRRQARIAFVSCTKDNQEQQAAMWQSVVHARPDLLVFLGDNVYTDLRILDKLRMTEETMWYRYIETRLTLAIYHMPRLIPSIATWDDHDTGQNNSDSSWALMPEARKIFETAFPQRPIAGVLKRGPGLSLSYSAFEQSFLLLDGRSFRSAPESKGSMWGKAQESWLEQESYMTDKPVWIGNGTTFFTGYSRAESVEGDYPESLSWLRNLLSKRRHPALLVAGDRHYSEIQRLEPHLLGYESFEITSSGLHSSFRFTHDVRTDANRNRRVAYTSSHNFVLAETSTMQGKLSANLIGYGNNSRELFRVPLILKYS